GDDTASLPAPLVDWIASELDAHVVAWERQERWRPAYFLEVEREGERLPLYFRGARTEVEDGAAAIRFEAGVLRELERGGVPVPRVYGVCPDPCGIVMERSPGRANLATALDLAERRAVLRDYVEILARMHALDLAPFEALGLERPARDALGLCDVAKWEATYRKRKSRPEPLIEFVLGWLRRNVPEGRSRTSFLCVDSGQFLFDQGRVTALLDLELACLGDPAADLAGLRTRDLSEPLGDLAPAYAHYFALTGDEIPSRVIDHHTVRFAIYTPMAVAPIVAHPMPGLDLVQYLGWYHVYAKAPLDVIAHGMGLPDVEVPPLVAEETRDGPLHDALVRQLRQSAEGDGFRAYEVATSLRLAEYLRRVEKHGAPLEALDLADVSETLGEPVADWQAADRALEACVERAGPERDAELVQLFRRRTARRLQLLDPLLRELEGARIQLLD
ncbi:MAG: phosphotransferase family protein, partial [Myxococcota bacterium]|nr:phosphotransferase family protein [Myxococcota bacterium]